MGFRSQWTVKAKDVPKELRLPFIQHGYRPVHQPWSYYFKSMFHIHNETVNIWSHLIGCILIAYQTYIYYVIYEENDSDLRWTTLAFGLCCFTTLFNSAMTHLLHSKSVYVNYLIFMYDYVGVVSWGFGSVLWVMYGISEPITYDWLGPYFAPVEMVSTYIVFVIICTTKLWFGHDLANGNRKLMIVGCILPPGVSHLIPWFPRYIVCLSSTDCDISSLNHITFAWLSIAVMTLAFVLHRPESSCPNKFDILGQSHQIFHVFVIITQTLQFRAMYIDFQSKANTHCKPNFYHILCYIFILYLACLLTIFMSRSRIKRTIEQNKLK